MTLKLAETSVVKSLYRQSHTRLIYFLLHAVYRCVSVCLAVNKALSKVDNDARRASSRH